MLPCPTLRHREEEAFGYVAELMPGLSAFQRLARRSRAETKMERPPLEPKQAKFLLKCDEGEVLEAIYPL